MSQYPQLVYTDDEFGRASLANRIITVCQKSGGKSCVEDQESQYVKNCITAKLNQAVERCKEMGMNGVKVACKTGLKASSCDSTYSKSLSLSSKDSNYTTDAPFPVLHTLGGAGGGFLLALVIVAAVFVTFKLIKRKKSGKVKNDKKDTKKPLMKSNEKVSGKKPVASNTKKPVTPGSGTKTVKK